MPTRIQDAVASVLLGALAVLVYHSATRIPPSLLDPRFGAGLLPRLLAVILGVLAVGLLVEALRKTHAAGSPAVPRQSLKTALVCGVHIVLLAGYIAALQFELAPFFVLSAVFVAVVSLALGGLSWRNLIVSVIVALASAALVQFVFTDVFSVFLP